jgi:YHS domain-containing protein
VQDPDDFLNAQKIAFDCAVEPGRAAVIDVAHRMRLGNDWFYFSSPQAKRKFQKDPLRYAALLSDPVDHDRFRPTKRSPQTSYRKVRFYFATPQARRAFSATPDSFAFARNMMLP